MAKKFDVMETAVKVKRGELPYTKVPPQHRAAVQQALNQEGKLVQHMRNARPDTKFRGEPIRYGNVRSF